MRIRLHGLTCTILESKVRCVRGEDSEGLRRSGCQKLQKLQVAPVAGCQARGFGGRPKCAPNPDAANSGPGRASLRPEAPRASLRVRAAVGPSPTRGRAAATGTAAIGQWPTRARLPRSPQGGLGLGGGSGASARARGVPGAHADAPRRLAACSPPPVEGGSESSAGKHHSFPNPGS